MIFAMKSMRSGVFYLSTFFFHAAYVYGQLPDFLTTQKEQNAGSVELEVSYDGNQIFDGEQFGVDEVQTLPSFAMCDSCGISTSSKYIIAMIDIDLPGSDSATTNAPQFLHYLRPGFQIADGTWLNSTVQAAVQYTPPAPPAGTGPHRYVWLLYNQPLNDDFELQGVPGSTQERAGFDVQKWEEENGFEGGPEWAVYFVAEEGVQPTRTTTTQAPTSTIPSTPEGTGESAPTTVFVTVTPSASGDGREVVPTESPGGAGDDSNNGALSRFGGVSLLAMSMGIVVAGFVFMGW